MPAAAEGRWSRFVDCAIELRQELIGDIDEDPHPNLRNGKEVIVRINDRGPYKGGRIIDLSRAAARRLEMEVDGVSRVRIEVLGD